MANMSYCRFQNTLPDLQACYEHWEEAESEAEKRAQRKLLILCQEIVTDYGEEDGAQ